MNEQEKIATAKRRVEAMTGFYVHLAVFIVVMVVLVAVDASVGKSWWVQWPLLGWGVGVAAHALIVFGSMPNFIRQWQVRKIDEIRQKL